MAEKLRECPFCGGKALLEEFVVRKGHEACIVCSDCMVCMPTITYDTEEEAREAVVKDWNRRAEPQKLFDTVSNIDWREQEGGE